jgi:phenylalanyl-tRNA synthetase beta chain
MLIERSALCLELPALLDISPQALCELLAALGFPVDGLEERDGATILEVDITANRGDVMSHRGLARDLAAKLAAELPPLADPRVDEGMEPLVPVRLDNPACSIYATAVLELGPAQFTPVEVQAFLRSMGSTPKNLAAVDASNELLHRYGQPTHAFDADRLAGGITVRWAAVGETLVTLDGVDRKLDARDLVIADESGPIALAGVMGGEATKVTEATRRVLLESAHFDPKAIRLTARRHNLHTDASHRFGRGADPAMAKPGRDLLLRRLENWAGARVEGVWSAGRLHEGSAKVVLPKDLLQRIAGEPLSLAEASERLQRLGCRVGTEPGLLHVTPPSWRHDLAIPEDLAEEVLRLRGYDRIPTELPPLEGPPLPLSPDYLHARRLAARLAHLGFHQTVTFGFTGAAEDAPAAATPSAGRTLGNPLGQEFAVMRGSLLPSLKSAALANLRQGAGQARLFEIAPTYASAASGPVETRALAAVWGGTLGGRDPFSPARPVAEADLRGVAQDLGAPLEQVRIQDLGEGLFGLEVPLALLPQAQERIIPGFRPFSRFPAVERDLSLLVDADAHHPSLVKAMLDRLTPLAGKTLQDLRCVDVFRHKSLPIGKQAWLMRLVFQHPDRTLTGEEIDSWMAAALEAARSTGADLRG